MVIKEGKRSRSRLTAETLTSDDAGILSPKRDKSSRSREVLIPDADHNEGKLVVARLGINTHKQHAHVRSTGRHGVLFTGDCGKMKVKGIGGEDGRLREAVGEGVKRKALMYNRMSRSIIYFFHACCLRLLEQQQQLLPSDSCEQAA